MVGRAQRASAASDVSGALEKQAKRPPNAKKKLHKTRGNTKQSNRTHRNKMRYTLKERRFPFHVESGSCWRFLEPRRAQDAPKTLSQRCWSWSSILERFWSDFLPNLALKIDQNRRKIEVKTPSISTSILKLFFDRFGIDFGRFLATKTEPTWHQIHWKINANFERPIFTKTFKNQCFFNVF